MTAVDPTSAEATPDESVVPTADVSTQPPAGQGGGPHRLLGWILVRAVLRTVFRVVRGIVLTAVIVLLAVVGLLAWLTQTDAGRVVVADAVSSIVSDYVLVGELGIGGLEGPFLGRLVATDVVLTDGDGRRAIQVGRVEVRYSLRALLAGRVDVQRLAISRLRVDARITRDGGFNLARLVPASTEPDTPASSGIAVDLREIWVDGSRFVMRDERNAGARLVQIDDLALAGSFELGTDFAMDIALSEVSADVAPPVALDSRFAVRLREVGAQIQGDRLSATLASIGVGNTGLEDLSATIELDPTGEQIFRTLQADFPAVHLDPEEANVLVSGLNLLRPLDIRTYVAGTPDALSLRLEADAKGNQARLSFELDITDPAVPGYEGRVEIVRFKPQELIELNGLTGDISALLTVRGRGITPNDAEAQLRLDVGPSRVLDYGLEYAWVTARATYGEFVLDSLELQAMGAHLRASATGYLDGEVGLDVSLDAPDLTEVTRQVPSAGVVEGSIFANLHIEGAVPVERLQELAAAEPFAMITALLEELQVVGEVRVRGLAAGPLQIGRLELDASTPATAEARLMAQLRVRDARVAGSGGFERLDVIGDLRPDQAYLQVDLQDPPTRRVLSTTLTARWSGLQATIRIARLMASQGIFRLRADNAPDVTIELTEDWGLSSVALSDARLQVSDAAVALQGSWRSTGEIAGSVRTEPVDLASVNSLLRLVPELQGRAAVAANVSGTLAAPRGQATLSVTDVSSGPVEDFDAEVSASLTSRDIRVDGTASLGGREILALETFAGGFPMAVNLETGSFRLLDEQAFGIRGTLRPVEVGPFLSRVPALASFRPSGEVSTAFEVSGTLEDPQVRADLELASGSVSIPVTLAAQTVGGLEQKPQTEYVTLDGLSFVAATEYTFTTRAESDWFTFVRDLAPEGMVSREALLGGAQIAGCAPSPLAVRRQGRGEDAAQGGRQDQPGLRAALWLDRGGCPVVSTDIFIDADIRPILDDPGALSLWASQAAGETLRTASQRNRARRVAAWLDGITLEIHGDMGPVASSLLPPSLRDAFGLRDGLASLLVDVSASRTGGQAQVAAALDHLVMAGVPPVTSVAVARLDADGARFEVTTGIGDTVLAATLAGLPPFEVLAADVADALVSPEEGLVRLVGTLPWTWNDVTAGRIELDRPLQSRLHVVRLPLVPWIEALELQESFALGGTDEDPLALFRRARVAGFLDIAGSVAAPELFSRLALRGLQVDAEHAWTAGIELQHLANEVSASLFLQDDERSLLDVSARFFAPANFRERLAEVENLLRETSLEVNLRMVDANLRRLLPPSLVATWLDEVSGRMDAQVVLTGSVWSPFMEGTVAMRDARLGVIPLGRRFDHVELDAAFTRQSIDLQHLRLRDATGSADLSGTIDLDGVLPSAISLALDLQNFLLADPSGAGVFVTGDVTVEGDTEDGVFSPLVTLDRLRVDVPASNSSAAYGPTVAPGTILWINEDVAPDQVGAREPELLAESAANSSFDLPIRADVRVVTEGVNELHHSLADTRFEVDLTTRIRGDSYAIRGTVRVPSGQVSVAGKQFEITRGFVTFNGEADTVNPVIDFRAQHTLSSDVAGRLEPASSGEANVTVVVDGTLNDLFRSGSDAIRLQSDPQLSQEDIIFVLLTGRPRDSESEVQGDQQALATASSLAAGLLADQLLSASGIPIDTIRIDGDAQSGQAFARVEGGKYIGDNLYIGATYINSTDVRENDFELSLEWIILRLGSASVRAEMRGGNRGNGGLELLYNLTRPGRRRVREPARPAAPEQTAPDEGSAQMPTEPPP